MAGWVHRLTELDVLARTAVCSTCGPVHVVRSGVKPGWRCVVAWSKTHVGKDYKRPIRGTCPICGEEGLLVWDHNHKTSKGRGHICGHCNRLLGFARDRPEVLRAAAAYLERG